MSTAVMIIVVGSTSISTTIEMIMIGMPIMIISPTLKPLLLAVAAPDGTLSRLRRG